MMLKRGLCWVVPFLLFFGCANMQTTKKQFIGVEQKLQMRDYQGAIAQIEASKEKGYKQKDRVVYYLDLGMLYHYSGNYEESTEYLSKAEASMEELYTESVSKAGMSLLLNDNALEYAGEDYENIYLNVFKALNFIEEYKSAKKRKESGLALEKFDAAFVEIRRIDTKLTMLENKYKKLAESMNSSADKKVDIATGENKFHNSALARLLSLLLYRAEENFDDASLDLQKIKDAWRAQGHIYNFAMPKLDGYAQKSSKVKLDIISFTGLAPDKKANTLYVHTEKDYLTIASTSENKKGQQKLDSYDNISWPGIKEGYHFKFQLPYLEARKSYIAKIKVTVDSSYVTELSKLEDISNVAITTFEVKKPMLFLKTITRSVTKGLLAEAAKENMNKKENNGFGSLTSLLTDIAVDATENADLRISRFFPSLASITELELSPGLHNIEISYLAADGSVLLVDRYPNYEIRNDQLNLLESCFLY